MSIPATDSEGSTKLTVAVKELSPISDGPAAANARPLFCKNLAVLQIIGFAIKMGRGFSPTNADKSAFIH